MSNKKDSYLKKGWVYTGLSILLTQKRQRVKWRKMIKELFDWKISPCPCLPDRQASLPKRGLNRNNRGWSMIGLDFIKL
jgi:hypothetical protein